MTYRTRFIGHLVSTAFGTGPYAGRGVGAVETRSPKQEDRKSPAALAAERVMNVRRVIRSGNTDTGVYGGTRL
jgi:hypothetical protein